MLCRRGRIPCAGTPQARHAHALLAGGERRSRLCFPALSSDLLKAGAIKGRAGLAMRARAAGIRSVPAARPRLRPLLPVPAVSRERLSRATRRGGGHRGPSPNPRRRRRERSSDRRQAISVVLARTTRGSQKNPLGGFGRRRFRARNSDDVAAG